MHKKLGSNLMLELIQFAKEKNPVWPFAAMIVDEDNRCLIKTTDCAHISPLYHAESLAIHLLITKLGFKNSQNLTLISTVEPDTLSLSTIYWSNIVQELGIKNIMYGSCFESIQTLWPFGIQIKAQELLESSAISDIKLTGPIAETQCAKLFSEAKEIQNKINDKHPGMVTLSDKVEDFYEI